MFRPRPLLSVLLLLLLLLCACGADAPRRIVAIGDLHGDYDAALRALRLAGAIDGEANWCGGRLTVVQVGDVLDRGDGEQAIMDLLFGLRDEARRDGGAVHVLCGNHELMNVDLDLRYVTPGGFADFEDAVDWDPADSTLAAFPAEQRARVAAFRPGGDYARKLAEGGVALLLEGTVFVHGGLLPEHVDYGVGLINGETRAWLRGETERPACTRGARSPVWTRLYSSDPAPAAADTLRLVLDALGARRMVVGHTVQEGGITPRWDGALWCVDAGMAAHYGGPVEVLEITGDEARVLREPPPRDGDQ